MRIALIGCLTALLMLTACGGNDGGKLPADTGTDVVAGDGLGADLETPDTQGPGDVTTDGQPGPDAVEDAAGDVPIQPAGYSEYLLGLLCAQYCNANQECETVTYGPTCMDDCLAQAAADEGFAKRLACARNAEEDGEYCDALVNCPEDFELDADCAELCDAVAACDALGGEFFGETVADCTLVCSASLGLNPAVGEQLKPCLADAFAQCSGAMFLDCIQESEDLCETQVCLEDAQDPCAIVPDPFATVADCTAGCADWHAGQQLAAESCLNLLTDLPVDCQAGRQACRDLPAELPEGALNYCTAYVDHCGAPAETAGLGALWNDLCAWQLTGIVQVNPEGFQSFVTGTDCVNGLETCPSGNLSMLYCLLDIPAEYADVCNAVDTVCEGETAAQMRFECEAALGFANGFVPDALQMIAQCAENAADCDSLGQCFFGDEEE